jgi:hypothetical protein
MLDIGLPASQREELHHLTCLTITDCVGQVAAGFGEIVYSFCNFAKNRGVVI